MAEAAEQARLLALLSGAEEEAAKREEFKREVADAAMAAVHTELSVVRAEMSEHRQAAAEQLTRFEKRVLAALAGGTRG